MNKIFILIFLTIFSFGATLPKGYYEIKNIQAMKYAFFSFMLKLAVEENGRILYDREFIQTYYKDIKTNQNKDIKKYFYSLLKRYNLKENATLKECLKRIDIIPVSLVLAQSAVESGWGKSRFFKQANNIFGQWTWTGKGLNPLQRDKGKTHKVAIFDSLETSVYKYMMNLNVGWAYRDFRAKREELRENNKPILGSILAKTLVNYSAKKEAYTTILTNMIRRNHLYRYDIQ